MDYKRGYVSSREKAWRNVLVATINYGLEQELFALSPGVNLWPRRENSLNGCDFSFNILGIPAVGYVGASPYDELHFHVTLWPTDMGRRFIASNDGRGDWRGQMSAHGWLERRLGPWLQTPNSPRLYIKRSREAQVAALQVDPNGYADRGPFIL